MTQTNVHPTHDVQHQGTQHQGTQHHTAQGGATLSVHTHLIMRLASRCCPPGVGAPQLTGQVQGVLKDPRAARQALRTALAGLHAHAGYYNVHEAHSGGAEHVAAGWEQARAGELSGLLLVALGLSGHLRRTYGISLEEAVSES